MLNTTTYHPQFFTATIVEWKKLLTQEKYKLIITNALDYLSKENKVTVFCFVIMDNHLHIIWQMKNENSREKVQHSFLSYTAKQFKKELQMENTELLKHFKIESKDRMYQFWQRNSLSVDLYTPKVFFQKMEYIHQNPVKAGLCKYPEDYYFSSALFYYNGFSEFSFLTHYNG
jgi:putative transposase